MAWTHTVDFERYEHLPGRKCLMKRSSSDLVFSKLDPHYELEAGISEPFIIYSNNLEDFLVNKRLLSHNLLPNEVT